MLVVEQTLSCDICGSQIRHLKQSYQHGQVVQQIDRGQIDRGQSGPGPWKDVCNDCFGHLIKAFWAVKNAAEGRE